MFLPAISGHVPAGMVQALAAFTDFCYLVRCNVITAKTIMAIQNKLQEFHQHRRIFQSTKVVDKKISLPRQHSMTHYVYLITQFGAPNGLCSSITESKHIKAVKEPWRTNKHCPLGQMLLINQRLDKLAALRSNARAKGLLPNPYQSHGAILAKKQKRSAESDNDSNTNSDGFVKASIRLAKRKGE